MDKAKIIEMAKARGLDIAEETLEASCHLAMDIIKEVAKDNGLALGVVVAIEPTVREAIDGIDIDGDGK